jgi:long-chain acyl-CoA synthetase
LDMGADDDILQVLPCFHSNASLIGVVFAWHLGSSAILVDRFDPLSFSEAVKQTRPTFFGGVPTVLYDMLRLDQEIDFDFSSVRYVIYGGAPAPHQIRRTVEGRFGLRLLQAYGMTEAPNIVALDPIEPQQVIEKAAGKPLPHIQVDIVDTAGELLNTGEVGEICIGPKLDGEHAGLYRPMVGYWNDPGTTQEALQGGVFHTGDMGMLDDSGFLHIIDRKKDMIIRGGNNIFPAELERVLDKHPDIEEAYVVGEPHIRLGEVPKAFVVLREGGVVSAEGIQRYVAARVARYKRVETVAIVERDSLPRNALGKVIKRALRSGEDPPS